jgi:hypothetical protein
MYGIYANIYHQYTPNVSIYTIHGSYGYLDQHQSMGIRTTKKNSEKQRLSGGTSARP